MTTKSNEVKPEHGQSEHSAAERQQRVVSVRLEKLERVGQISKRDVILMVMKNGEVVPGRAKVVIRSGEPSEEVVYRRLENHYFITGMVLDGASNVRDCYIVRAD